MRRLIPTVLVAAAVAVLAAAGTVAAQATQRFTDIPPGNWAERGAAFVVDCGIFPVKDDGSFGVNDQLTRGRLAKALYQYHHGCGRQSQAPEFTDSGIGEGFDEDAIVTDDVALEPGYYQVRVWVDEAPGFDWTDGEARDFYVWFGTKTGGHILVNASRTTTPFGYLELRVDEAADYWFAIRADEDFVWWANVNANPTPEGVSFD
ncbi:MAG: S-layer homology domain-containing protein [Acidimicrobiaceae bacterium]|nr:S-layer homology domain-containing protein [Acidimicrobiaceae bacterium]